MNPSLTVSQVQRPLIDYTITRPSQTASPDAKEGRSSSVSQDWTPEERKQFEKEAEFLSDLGAGATALKRLHLHYDHEKAAKTEQAIIVDKAHPKHMPPPAPKKNVFVQTGALTAREYRNRLRLWPVVAARFIISAIQVTFSAITFASCARDLVKASQPGANGGDSVPMTTAQQFGQQIILVQQSVAQVAFSIFMSAGFQMIFLLPQERAVFLREYTSNYYGINAYLTAKLTWEVPQIVLHSLIVLTIPYFAYGMNSPYYFIFPLLVLFGITGSTLGLLLVSINPDSGELPILLGPLVMATLPNIFSSIFKPLPQVWAGFRWLSYITPSAFFFPVSMYLEFGQTELDSDVPDDAKKAYKLARDDYLSERNAWSNTVLFNILAMVVLTLVFRTLGMVMMAMKSTHLL